MTFSWFFEYLGDLDWVAALLGMLAVMVLGYVWYGPLFGKLWASKSGLAMQEGQPVKMALTAAYFLVFNLGLQYLNLVLPDFDIQHALVAGIVLAVLAIGPALYSQVVWSKKNTTVFLIDLSFWFVATAVAVLVQGLIV